MGGWSDTDNKANLSPASLRYAANGAVAELSNTFLLQTEAHMNYFGFLLVSGKETYQAGHVSCSVCSQFFLFYLNESFRDFGYTLLKQVEQILLQTEISRNYFGFHFSLRQGDLISSSCQLLCLASVFVIYLYT